MAHITNTKYACIFTYKSHYNLYTPQNHLLLLVNLIGFLTLQYSFLTLISVVQKEREGEKKTKTK